MKHPLIEIYLHRHPQIDIEAGICYGQTDLDLRSDLFEAWKQNFKDGQSGNLVITSPSTRCKKPAEFIARSLSAPDPVVLNEIIEMNFGAWEMRSWEDLRSDGTSGYVEWSKDWVNLPVPQGESYRDLSRRVLGGWKKIIKDSTESDIRRLDIVTHAGPIRAILSELLHIPLENTFRLEIHYGSVSKIKISGDLPLVEYINRQSG